MAKRIWYVTERESGKRLGEFVSEDEVDLTYTEVRKEPDNRTRLMVELFQRWSDVRWDNRYDEHSFDEALDFLELASRAKRWGRVADYVLDNYVPKKIAEEKIEKLAQRYSGHPDSIWNSPNTNRAFWREKVLSMLHYDTP